jgi:Arc/MetJ-type ribon-helix-helix transcriptional regulator
MLDRDGDIQKSLKRSYKGFIVNTASWIPQIQVSKKVVLVRGGIQMPKKVLIALPPAMLEQVDFIAQCEHRTRSDLIREALRRYLDNFRRSQQSHNMTVSTIETPQGVSSPIS